MTRPGSAHDSSAVVGTVQIMNSSDDGTEVPFRPTVLILVGYYLPGYKSGGPVRSISNFVEKLGDEFDFKIITSDRDFGDREPYNGIQPERWISVGKAKVLYVRNGDPPTILKHIRATPHDVLYLSSFFARGFSIIPQCASAVGAFRTPCVILAPHGEFSQGALGIKHKRKLAFIGFTRMLPAYQRVIWHASSQYEAHDVQRLFGDHLRRESPWYFWAWRGLTPRPISVITALDFASGDASGAAVTQERAAKPRGALRAVFLSRIARMKNLSTAIRTLQDVHGRVTFDVYGPVEDPLYWHECQDLIASLPANVHVRYRGPIKHEDVHGTLSGYDMYFLPTCGEAYGHVVVEA